MSSLAVATANSAVREFTFLHRRHPGIGGEWSPEYSGDKCTSPHCPFEDQDGPSNLLPWMSDSGSRARALQTPLYAGGDWAPFTSLTLQVSGTEICDVLEVLHQADEYPLPSETSDRSDEEAARGMLSAVQDLLTNKPARDALVDRFFDENAGAIKEELGKTK